MSTQHSTKNRAAPSLVCLFILVSIVGTFIAPSTALAHNVNVFAYVEGDDVMTESYFNDGRKCRDATIEVFDGGGNKLAEGKTDEKGLFSFRPPTRTDLVIRLTASMGHRAEYTVPAQDLPSEFKESNETPKTLGKAAEDSPDQAHPETAHDPPADSLDSEYYEPAEIERIVDKVVSQRLAPMRRALEEARRERRLSDIIGGIGYIVGLMGLAMYFRSRLKLGQ